MLYFTEQFWLFSAFAIAGPGQLPIETYVFSSHEQLLEVRYVRARLIQELHHTNVVADFGLQL